MRVLNQFNSVLIGPPLVVHNLKTCCLGEQIVAKQFASSSPHSGGRASLFKTTIGLEIHVQINSKSKLFSRSPNQFFSPPNVNVSLFDCAIPGTLPIINRYCIESAVKTGLALNCKISEECCFDRKHYFYPDTPTGYQITQKRQPIASDGYLLYPSFRYKERSVQIKKADLIAIQLEQDAGKTISFTETKQNLLDLNRCGVGLMELVFQPCLDDEDDAAFLVKELIQVLKRLDVSTCKMDLGVLRIDANISVFNNKSGKSGDKVEIKNLNSINSLSRALDYEKRRQIKLLKGDHPVPSETRFYDPVECFTYPIRKKDDYQDYRFIPEPNLPPLRLALEHDINPNIISVGRLQDSLPELPNQERDHLTQHFKVPIYLAACIVNNDLYNFFLQIVDLKARVEAKELAEYLGIDVIRCLENLNKTIHDVQIAPSFIAESLEFVKDKKISVSMAIDLLETHMNGDPRSAGVLVEERGLKLAEDESLVREECRKVIELYPNTAAIAKKSVLKALELLCEGVERRCNKRYSRGLIYTTIEQLIKEADERELKKAAKLQYQKLREAANLFSEKEKIDKNNT